MQKSEVSLCQGNLRDLVPILVVLSLLMIDTARVIRAYPIETTTSTNEIRSLTKGMVGLGKELEIDTLSFTPSVKNVRRMTN